MMKRLTLLCCSLLLLSSCGGSSSNMAESEKAPPPPPPVDRGGIAEDVPLYYLDADAKKLDHEITETDIIITMETINGPLSPITYYRKLKDSDWKVVEDTEDDGGTLLATKRGRELEVTFEALPGGAGTLITLRTTK